MNLHQGLKVFLCLLLGIATPFGAWAAIDDQNPPLVEVHIPQDNLATYKERRLDHGYSVAIGYEALVLNKFTSALDGSTYDETYGSGSIPLIKINLDYKYNIGIGSLSAGFEYGYGENSGEFNGDTRSLEVSKMGFVAKYAADAIWSEPYIVPYVGLTAWQMSFTEKSGTDSHSETNPIGYNYTVGLMFQLNWLDLNTAKDATFNLGLENTFMDLYITQYENSGGDADVNTETDLLYGANLRFEF